MMSKLTAVDKSMVSGRLSGLLTYSNFVHAVSGATVSTNYFEILFTVYLQYDTFGKLLYVQ